MCEVSETNATRGEFIKEMKSNNAKFMAFCKDKNGAKYIMYKHPNNGGINAMCSFNFKKYWLSIDYEMAKQLIVKKKPILLFCDMID